MCGIFGSVGATLSPETEEIILQALYHRGPNDSGIFRDKDVTFIHTRLSIIDLTEAGHQPMVSDDGNLVIAYNGEIYNFTDIREVLEKDYALSFTSDTDTEVVLKAYQVWGEECLKKFRGMFSFAILDRNERKIFLARDRLGQKPLFYYMNGKRFVFASELRALLSCKDVPRTVNLESIYYFMPYHYIPAPLTGFENIYKIPPAHYLILNKGEIRVEKYWEVNFSDKIQVVDEKSLCEELLEQLEESVRMRLVSDVPLGAFLSGGVDSSAIVALMSRMTDKPIKTFSIGFEEDNYSETPYSRQIAKLFNTEHHEFVVKYGATEILPQLVRNFGEPFADSSALPLFYLSKMTRKRVTVALSGDGSDESFAGYDRYAALKLSERLKRIPGVLFKPLLYSLNLFPQTDQKQGMTQRLRRFLQGVLAGSGKTYIEWILNCSKDDEESLYSSSFKDAVRGRDNHTVLMNLFHNSSAENIIEKAMDVDIHSYLPYDLLVKVDIASMANSLEARAPFLDHRLIEFAARLPLQYKLKGMKKKYILKKAFEGIIPQEVLKRPKKGFGVPIAKWFRGGLKDYLINHLMSNQAIKRGYFKEQFIEKLLREHTTGLKDHSHMLWSLLTLELWHKEVIDGA